MKLAAWLTLQGVVKVFLLYLASVAAVAVPLPNLDQGTYFGAF